MFPSWKQKVFVFYEMTHAHTHTYTLTHTHKHIRARENTSTHVCVGDYGAKTQIHKNVKKSKPEHELPKLAHVP